MVPLAAAGVLRAGRVVLEGVKYKGIQAPIQRSLPTVYLPTVVPLFAVADARLILVVLSAAVAGAQQAAVDFNRDIEPIFRQHCLGCHGSAQQQSGLSLASRDDALRGGYSGPAIAPGDGSGSRLVAMLRRPESEGPPMPLGRDRLPPDRIALLSAWIDQGARWPASDAQGQSAPPSKHWSHVPPVRPGVPRVAGGAWIRNPIDSFVAARLEREGLQPSPEAPPEVLLRRLTFDLTGLPPSAADIGSLAAGGYERVVERLLASPHHGEMQAVHWLDQARFGESDGYQADFIRPHAWRWRHWVIDAFNRNPGFDRFTIEQIAGDLVPGATIDQRVATGFHRNSLHNREGGFELEMDRVERTVDRTSAVATVWLGLTVGCARCHDHKFDPISQADFYRLYAFFNTAVETNIDAPLPGEREPYLERRPEYERRRDELFRRYKVPELQAYWEQRILAAASDPSSDLEPIWKILWDLLIFEVDGSREAVETPPDRRAPRQRELLSGYFVKSVVGGYDFQEPEGYEDLDFDELKRAYRALEEEFPQLTQGYAMMASPDPPQTRILVRGDYRRPGVPVEPATPSALPALPGGKADRLALGRWLVSRENPLTARVIANRVWQRYFGTGLVSTPEDFGSRGERPSHPELLDWLAVEFMDSGWDLKALHRAIVTSATYRQSSNLRPELQQRDPGNRLLARQSRLRLPAESIRDAALAAAGLLDRRVGGPSVRPYLPEGATEIGFGDFVKWPQSAGADKYRRGLYIFRQRTLPYPQLETFDAPDTVQVACKRERSTTPLQALTLLNDPVFVEAARELAARARAEAGDSIPESLRLAFRLCLSREPTQPEFDVLLRNYERQRLNLSGSSPPGVEPASVAEDDPDREREIATLAAVASVLLNLAEFLTRA